MRPNLNIFTLFAIFALSSSAYAYPTAVPADRLSEVKKTVHDILGRQGNLKCDLQGSKVLGMTISPEQLIASSTNAWADNSALPTYEFAQTYNQSQTVIMVTLSRDGSSLVSLMQIESDPQPATVSDAKGSSLVSELVPYQIEECKPLADLQNEQVTVNAIKSGTLPTASLEGALGVGYEASTSTVR